MRATVVLLGLALLGGVFFWVQPTPDPWVRPNEDSSSGEVADHWRREGTAEAERDIARGTPWLRRPLAFRGPRRPLDEATGLPIRNTSQRCGTGVDFDRYRAVNEAYNERILAAYRAGRLTRFTFHRKRRAPETIRRLFESGSVVRLEKSGDELDVANGRFTLVLRRRVLAVRSGEGRLRQILYDPDHLKGPVEIVLADRETTAIVRDESGDTWILDIPRRVLVQGP